VGTGGVLVASAATPEFPNNLVVFPDRDFLAVEGYQDRVGQTALIEVTRGGEVVGSAKATIAEGDPRHRGQPPRRRLLGRRDGSEGDARHPRG
jgi:hypothetical protein